MGFFILHAGQYDSHNLDSIFFGNFECGSRTHIEDTGNMLMGLEKILLEDKPDAAVGEGDAGCVLGGLLATGKVHIRVGHVKARLRSYDKNMPDKVNTIPNAAVILTDSGGIQEEACVMQVPCITLRDYTQRAENLEVGCNILARPNPFADAQSGVTIVKAIHGTQKAEGQI